MKLSKKQQEVVNAMNDGYSMYKTNGLYPKVRLHKNGNHLDITISTWFKLWELGVVEKYETTVTADYYRLKPQTNDTKGS